MRGRLADGARFERLGRDKDGVLPAKVADQIEGLQSLHDVVRAEVRHVRELLDGDGPTVLRQNVKQRVHLRRVDALSTRSGGRAQRSRVRARAQ